MNQELDIEIYSHISNEMDVAEIYLGSVPFSFEYTKAEYIATCTEAFPFNPFDKAICKILKVEDQLSFESIGEILGLNVCASENPKRYLDLAEKEILAEALQSLSSLDFKMIETGDINFSRCRLTAIGREYTEKGSKYKITIYKPFTLFFDHTTGNHIQAKEHFEFANGKRSMKRYWTEWTNESTLKQLAIIQTPEIYNPTEERSFTDASLEEEMNFNIEYPVAITFNSQTNLFHFYCYDTAHKCVHKYFNGWINDNENITEYLVEVLSESISTNYVPTHNILDVFSEQISTFLPGSKIGSIKTDLLKKEFVDEYLLFSSFNEIFNTKDKAEIYLCLPFVTKIILNSIRAIIQNSENIHSRFYFVFPLHIPEKTQVEVDQLKLIASSTANFLVIQERVKSFWLCLKTEIQSFYIEIVPSSINGFTKNFSQRKTWDKQSAQIESYILEQFSDKCALMICHEVNETVNNYIQQTVNKSQLDILSLYEFKLEPFADIGQHGQTVSLTLELINSFKEERIEKLEEKLKDQINNIEAKLARVKDENEFVEIQRQFTATTSEILYNDSEASKRCDSLKTAIAFKKIEFAEANKVFSFIIDTNILIEDTDIIKKIPAKHKVVITSKVLDELDKYKTNLIHKEAASNLLRKIFADENKNIHRAKADLKLLPPDFDRKSRDNLILATALIYKDRNGILISDNRGLQEKAITVEMPVMTYADFNSKFINSKR